MEDTTITLIKLGVPLFASGLGAVALWGLRTHMRVNDLTTKFTDLEQKVGESNEKLEELSDYNTRLAVIDSVVMALKDLPLLVAKIDALLEASAKRIEFIEDHIFNNKSK